MPYKVGDAVEILYEGKWYRGIVVAIGEVSADGYVCYRIVFDPSGNVDPLKTGHSLRILIPYEKAATWLRPYPGEAIEKAVGGGGAVGRGGADAEFKNSVNIRF